MVIKKEWIVFKDADSIMESEVYGRGGADKLFLQAIGTFTELIIEIQGKLHEDTDFVDGVSVSGRDIQEVDLTPYKYFKINIKAFTGTKVTIYARTTAQ